jgi:hypothetical protein
LALSAIDTAAPRDPIAVGVNVTLIEQLALTASVAGLAGHVLDCAKSPALVPVIAMLVKLSVPGPLLVTVMLWAALVVFVVWLPNITLVVEIPTTGIGATPMPLNVTLWGLPLPLSVRVTAALRDAAAVGVNVTLIVQLALTARVVGLIGHVLDFANSPASVPVMAMLVILSVPGPLFVTVIV